MDWNDNKQIFSDLVSTFLFLIGLSYTFILGIWRKTSAYYDSISFDLNTFLLGIYTLL